MSLALLICDSNSVFGGAEESDMPKTKQISKAGGLLILALVAGVWQGCATDSLPTAPFVSDTEDGRFPAGEPPEANPLDVPGPWTVVASEKVAPGKAIVVSGSRYTLSFPKGSVSKAVTITISEHDPNVVDVKLEPDGMVFKKPVTLVIDYSGTANDPNAAYHHPGPPLVYSNEWVTHGWDIVRGTDDSVSQTYTVFLDHFSRYAMKDGVVGWRRPGSQDLAPQDPRKRAEYL
jgi:hypothetical protein